jgi:putative phosphoesterase
MVVGLISDTHGQFRPAIATIFAGVDLIVHAGDVGGRAVLTALSAIAPVEAVSGNVDDRFDPLLPPTRTLPIGGLTLHVSHGDELGRPTPELLFARYQADLLVYGHTHRSLMVRGADDRLVINPGAAGPRRFNLQPSVAILRVDGRHATAEFFVID